MSGQSVAELTPVCFGESVETSLSRDQLATVQGGAYVAIPAGWTAQSGYTKTRTVGFAAVDRSAIPVGIMLSEQDLAAAGIRVAEYQDVAVTFFTLQCATDTCAVEVVALASPLARVWADSVTSIETLLPTPIGDVSARGPAFVVDAGDTLIRGTFDTAWAGEDQPTHMSIVVQGAQSFLDALVRTA